MKRGDVVEVVAYGDEVIQRRVVDVGPSHVYICSEDEWRTSSNPRSSGFPLRDFVRVVTPAEDAGEGDR